MKYTPLLIALLVTLGCQTPKHQCPVDPHTQLITVVPTLVNTRGVPVNSWGHKVNCRVAFKIVKEGKVAKASIMTLQPDDWDSTDISIDVRGIDQTASVLIEDEIVEINCEPGWHIKIKATPISNEEVYLRGVYSLSKSSNRDLTKLKEVFPFSVKCKIGETNTIYQIITKTD
jgi:hypothetical protein